MHKGGFPKYISRLSLFLLIAASCRPAPRFVDLSASTNYDVSQFPILPEPQFYDSQFYDSVIWRKDGQIVALISETDPFTENQPYVIEGDTTIRDLGLSQEKGCTLVTRYLLPTALPDGRLGLVKNCRTGVRGQSRGPETSYLIAYDWKTGEVEQLVKEPLPHPIRSGCFSWNPEMTRAIQGTYDGLSGGLYWLTRDGDEPLNLVLRDGIRSWDLRKSYVVLGTNKEEGIATCASWSPNGANIAFFATLEAIGREGLERGGRPYDLYLYSVKDGKAINILTDVYDPFNVEWSPDGNLIAFLGEISKTDRKETDLWILDPATNQLHLIASGFFRHYAWSPDSDEIAIISCTDILCADNSKTEIRRYPIELP